MQQQRRTNPYPWTWEPAAAIALALTTILAVGVQVGRGLALLATGHGWHWPAQNLLLTSLPGILAGHPATGLTLPDVTCPPGLLAATITLTEVALLAGMAVAGKWAWGRWGTGRTLGLASRDEAEQILGLTRLHHVRRIIRPDLYPKPQHPVRKVTP